MKEPHLLVIGANGTLGRALCSAAVAQGLMITRTASRPGPQESGDPGLVKLDLSGTNPLDGLDFGTVTHALLMAGVTSIAWCERNPREARVVNVEGSNRVVRALDSAGIATTVLSSSQVFSRYLPSPMPDSPRSPACEYGRQKVELEDLTVPLQGVQVIRLTKVLHPGSALLASWQDSLRAGRHVTAFANVAVAPMHLELAVKQLLHAAIADHSHRIVHMSSTDDISYFDLARTVAEYTGTSLDLLDPIVVEEDAAQGWIPGPHAALGAPYNPSGAEAESSHDAVAAALRSQGSAV